MSRKTRPQSLRIKGIDDWSSKGFYGRSFSHKLEEDFFVRKFLTEKLKEAGIDSLKIERSPGKMNIIIQSARPGLVIGRGGSGIEDLRKELKNRLIALRKRRKMKGDVVEPRIEIQEVRNPWLSASLIGQGIAKQLIKRIPFRRTIKHTLDSVMENKEIKGARIELAGRLDGADIARTEWLKKGRLPRQTLRADIDYAEVRALCTYGIIGIKVWLYKGDKFE